MSERDVLNLLPIAPLPRPPQGIDYKKLREIKLKNIQDCKKKYLENNGWGRKEGKDVDFYYNTAIMVDGKEKVKNHMSKCMETTSHQGGKRKGRLTRKRKRKSINKKKNKRGTIKRRRI